MSSFNQATIVGNLGRDPEIRSLNDGTRVCNLSIATSERWKDKTTGERKEKTEWHRIVVWGNLVDICERYLSKGSKVLVQGKIETRKWTDQSGSDRYSTEIVLRGFAAKMQMLDSRQDREDRGGGGGDYQGGYDASSGRQGSASGQTTGQQQPSFDDEIPF